MYNNIAFRWEWRNRHSQNFDKINFENGGIVANIKQQVEKLIEPIVSGFGLDLVDVVYEKKHDGMNLTVFIDKKGGADLNDCERVHRAIDEPLDTLDPTNGAAYTLNVSSAGLDRELKTDRDFERNLGEVLEVHLYKKQGGEKDFVGELKTYGEKSITLQTKKGEVEIERASISKATKYIEF